MTVPFKLTDLDDLKQLVYVVCPTKGCKVAEVVGKRGGVPLYAEREQIRCPLSDMGGERWVSCKHGGWKVAVPALRDAAARAAASAKPARFVASPK